MAWDTLYIFRQHKGVAHKNKNYMIKGCLDPIYIFSKDVSTFRFLQEFRYWDIVQVCCLLRLNCPINVSRNLNWISCYDSYTKIFISFELYFLLCQYIFRSKYVLGLSLYFLSVSFFSPSAAVAAAAVRIFQNNGQIRTECRCSILYTFAL